MTNSSTDLRRRLNHSTANHDQRTKPDGSTATKPVSYIGSERVRRQRPDILDEVSAENI